jgi:hypothetical protein
MSKKPAWKLGGIMTTTFASMGPRLLTKEERRMGEGRPAALETLTEPDKFEEDKSGLQLFDTADMYHAGTKKYYRVVVRHQVTEEEANYNG